MSNFILSLEFGGRGNTTDDYYLISQEMLEFSVMCSIKQRNLARANVHKGDDIVMFFNPILSLCKGYGNCYQSNPIASSGAL
jgi:hypothetical protein